MDAESRAPSAQFARADGAQIQHTIFGLVFPLIRPHFSHWLNVAAKNGQAHNHIGFECGLNEAPP